jgi:hypothetical protein
MELNDWLTILGALGGFEAIKWMVNFYVNRKTDARKEDASADSMEDENERKQVDWLEDRIAQRDTKIDAMYVGAFHLEDFYKRHELELCFLENRR